MKINEKTYYHEYSKLDQSKLSDSMKKMHDYVNRVTQNGSDWTNFHNKENANRVIRKHFESLELFIEDQLLSEKETNEKKESKKKPTRSRKTSADTNVDTITLKLELKNHFNLMNQKGVNRKHIPEDLLMHWNYLEEFNSELDKNIKAFLSDQEIQNKVQLAISKMRDFAYECDFKKQTPNNPNKNTRSKTKKTNTKKQDNPSKPIESLSLEVKMMKRYLNMDGKEKNRNQIRLFISALQKAIRERRITKKSRFAEIITVMQRELIKLHGEYKNDSDKIKITIIPKTKEKLLPIVGREIEMPTVKFIKSYINLQGKLIPVKKAHNLHTRITRAFNSGKFTDEDKYWSEIKKILANLEKFVENTKDEGILKIESRALNGLNGILSDCGCSTMPISNINAPRPLDIKQLTKQYLENQKGISGTEGFFMSSMDLDELEFEHVGLFGRWLHLIGDPARGARIAVYGNPKIGKSYLMIEFAGDLAKSGKKVLYVAKEEGKSATLKKKFRETNSKHPNLTVTDYIPNNLDEFDFVFFDSISKLKLTPENLLAIKWAYPNVIKVEIHQVNKEGKARGLNDFIHDVDSIIRLPERGLAIQEGRYEEYSEMHYDVAA